MPPSFKWDAVGDEATRLSYINPKPTFTIGNRNAWYTSDDFDARIWTQFLMPKLKNIFNQNQKEIFGSTRRKPFCALKCYMTSTSTDWRQARPTVIASCTKPKHASATVRVLSTNPIMTRLECGFDFYADPHASDTIACAGTTVLSPPDGDSILASLCGTRVLVTPFSHGNSLQFRSATIGGIIKIRGTSYALTAAHAFYTPGDASSDVTEDSDNHSSESATPSDLPHKSMGPPVTVPSYARTGSVFIDPAVYHRSVDDDDDDENSSVVYRASSPAITPEHKLGRLLIHGQSPAQDQSNDWALIEIDNLRLMRRPNSFRIGEAVVQCTDTTDLVPHQEVAVITGFGGTVLRQSHGRTEGILLPGAEEMVSAWTIEGGSLPGDCGSWVADPTTGSVYGMLVASSKRQHCSYCLPMSAIFDSITSSVGIRPVISTFNHDQGHHEDDKGKKNSDILQQASQEKIGEDDMTETYEVASKSEAIAADDSSQQDTNGVKMTREVPVDSEILPRTSSHGRPVSMETLPDPEALSSPQSAGRLSTNDPVLEDTREETEQETINGEREVGPPQAVTNVDRISPAKQDPTDSGAIPQYKASVRRSAVLSENSRGHQAGSLDQGHTIPSKSKFASHRPAPVRRDPDDNYRAWTVSHQDVYSRGRGRRDRRTEDGTVEIERSRSPQGYRPENHNRTDPGTVVIRSQDAEYIEVVRPSALSRSSEPEQKYEREEIDIRRDDPEIRRPFRYRYSGEESERDEIVIRRRDYDDDRGGKSVAFRDPPDREEYTDDYYARRRPVYEQPGGSQHANGRKRDARTDDWQPSLQGEFRPIEAAKLSSDILPEEEELLNRLRRSRTETSSTDKPRVQSYGNEPAVERGDAVPEGGVNLSTTHTETTRNKHRPRNSLDPSLNTKIDNFMATEAEVANEVAMRRCSAKEAYDGATLRSAIVDVPPGTVRVIIRGGRPSDSPWWDHCDRSEALSHPKGMKRTADGAISDTFAIETSYSELPVVWTPIECPPATSEVVFEGVGGGSQIITWNRFTGARWLRYIENSSSLPEGTGLGHRGTSSADEKGPEDSGAPWPRKGNTKVPKHLVEIEVLNKLGYQYHEQDHKTIVISVALNTHQIEKLFADSKQLRDKEHNVQPENIHATLPTSWSDQTSEIDRLRFKTKLQGVFLDNLLSNTHPVEAIMSLFDEVRSAPAARARGTKEPGEGEYRVTKVVENEDIAEDDIVEVFEEHATAQRPNPDATKATDSIADTTRRRPSRRVKASISAGTHDDNVDVKANDGVKTGRQLVDDALKSANQWLNSLSSPTDEDNQAEWSRLVREYKVQAMTRGLSLQEIKTIVDEIATEDLGARVTRLRKLVGRARTRPRPEPATLPKASHAHAQEATVRVPASQTAASTSRTERAWRYDDDDYFYSYDDRRNVGYGHGYDDYVPIPVPLSAKTEQGSSSQHRRRDDPIIISREREREPSPPSRRRTSPSTPARGTRWKEKEEEGSHVKTWYEDERYPNTDRGRHRDRDRDRDRYDDDSDYYSDDSRTGRNRHQRRSSRITALAAHAVGSFLEGYRAAAERKRERDRDRSWSRSRSRSRPRFMSRSLSRSRSRRRRAHRSRSRSRSPLRTSRARGGAIIEREVIVRRPRGEGVAAAAAAGAAAAAALAARRNEVIDHPD